MIRKKLKILVVEDAIADRELYRRFLTKHKTYQYDISYAENVKDALKIYMSASYDCVLLDYQLPDKSGLEFLDDVNRISNKKNHPVIFISGYGRQELINAAFKKGAIDFIEKSNLSPKLLFQAIETVIDKILTPDNIEKFYQDMVEHLPQSNHCFAKQLEKRLHHKASHQKDSFTLTLVEFSGNIFEQWQTMKSIAEHMNQTDSFYRLSNNIIAIISATVTPEETSLISTLSTVFNHESIHSHFLGNSVYPEDGQTAEALIAIAKRKLEHDKSLKKPSYEHIINLFVTKAEGDCQT